VSDQTKGEAAFQIKQDFIVHNDQLSLVTDRMPSSYEVRKLETDVPNRVTLTVRRQRSVMDFQLELSAQDWKHIGSPMPGTIIILKLEITGRG
jgi:hypothetical protein